MVSERRTAICSISISISKLHCVIVKTDGLLLLRDLGSTNGTRVNGQRVRRAALLPKDQLQIASLKYTVEVSADEPPASPDEFTQHLDGKDLEKLMEMADKPGEIDSDSSDVEIPMVRANALPRPLSGAGAREKVTGLSYAPKRIFVKTSNIPAGGGCAGSTEP